MKKCFLTGCLIIALTAQGQLIVNLQIPPGGVIQMNQIWNMLVTNTTSVNISASIMMTMTQNQTGEPILGASTSSIVFPPGTTMLNSSQLIPIQYNYLTNSLNFHNANLNSFLPPGSFLICYRFSGSTLPESATPPSCFVLDVTPLSPPILIIPEDQSTIDSTFYPIFSWMPPAPLNIFTDLKYDISIVQVSPNQTASDAIQLNIPVFFQQDLATTSFVYPLSASALEPGVQYAWQISAKNNRIPVSNSETWTFHLGNIMQKETTQSELPFTRLMKNGESGYAICPGLLKFAYVNETADTAWNIALYDISEPVKREISFSLDAIPMRRGLNLVQYDLTGNHSFLDLHMYLLELRNSRNEVWRLKFEYLKP